MLRPLFVGSLLLASPAGLAQTAAPAPKADEKKADEKKAEGTTPPAADAPPALPPATLPFGDDAAPPTAPAVPTAPTGDDLDRLKAQLKSELKAEVQAELKAQLQSELEAAARDQATAKAAAQEWQEERWIEEVKPKLNFLELDGYFRFRFDAFNRLDLGTFDPAAPGTNGLGRGTSGFPTPTLYRPFDGQGCTDGNPENSPGDPCSTTSEDTQTILSANMRLRVDPTLNVSEDIRIRSTVDVFDNIVLGSTPESLPGFAQNPTLPLPLFAASQNPPQAGLNSIYDAIRIRRLWAEVMTPVGQLRFGRMDQNFGLGLLANNGNKLDQDFGDNADQVVFGTRIAGHIIAPGYSFSSSGPFGRGGGAGAGGDLNQGFFQGEQGQRYNLDPRDDVHSVLLVIAKRDKEEDIEEQLRQGNWIANYGVFGVYRTQQYDIPSYYTAPGGASVTQNPPVDAGQYVNRKANAGIASVWGRFQVEKFRIEAEAVGIIGQIDGTSTSSGGLTSTAADLKTVVDGAVVDNPLFILQGGAAVESSYKLLGDALEVGVDGGIASGDDAPGFGHRPVITQTPRAGDLDGKQYGECLEDGDVEVDGVTCTRRDNDITNFRFDSDYIVDMILFREILGTVTDAFYVKPHISYSFTPDLGVRADVIYSQAVFASSTPGQQNPLGLELDLRAWYGTDDGFYFMPQFGVLLPFAGLNHWEETQLSDEKFRTAQFAWTGQLFAGVQF
ncbi:MAG: TIGR04551 family protein [Deltaproteobacteria bacterium]|nr:TIGR04551 family protein [Deltaproteobacteria bacterium]